MPLDLYADELVPESTARQPSPVMGWLGPVVMAVLVCLGAWFYVSRHSPSPDVDPSPEPTPCPVVASGLHVLIVEETDSPERAKLSAILSCGD